MDPKILENITTALSLIYEIAETLLDPLDRRVSCLLDCVNALVEIEAKNPNKEST